MTFAQLKPMLSWRYCLIGLRGLTPTMFAETLSVEELPRECIPKRFQQEVVGFRKRSWQDRIVIARRYLNERRSRD